MTFSERQGLVPKKVLQTDSIDEGLRNRLWNILLSCFDCNAQYYLSHRENASFRILCERLWHDHFKLAIDTIPEWPLQAIQQIRQRFFQCEWNKAYDFAEFVAEHSKFVPVISKCNQVLESELSAYRFVAGKLVPISSERENQTIETAIAQTSDKYKNVSEHLRQAVILLARKPTPDYRNSIKESISAVEALCAEITGKPKATLGDALKFIENYAPLHGALRDAFNKLYGYTSDAEGIRHALMGEPHLQQEDAVFMLAACSAFISYVLAKRARKPVAKAQRRD